MAAGRIASGASVAVFVNGTPLGIASVVDWAIETPARTIHGLDAPEPYELAVTTARVIGSLKVWRLERSGGAEGAGLAAPLAVLPRGRYFTLSLVDRRFESVLFQTDRAYVTSQRWNAPVKGLVTGTIAFEAIGAINEADG